MQSDSVLKGLAYGGVASCVAETSARAMLRSWRQYSEVRDGFVLGGLIWPNIPADLTPVGMLGTSTFVVF